MSSEREASQPLPVEVIHYFCDDKRFVIEVAGGPVFSLTHLPDGIFYQLIEARSVSERSVERLVDELERVPATDDAVVGEQRAPTTVVPGRIQGRAKEGRVDGRGRPTAWGRFLAHIDGEEGASLLSTTFHGRTRDIVLGLPEDASITAQGYLRRVTGANPEQRRMPTFSVIHLLQYPGKPEPSDS
jgi:hypothetical protein